MTVLFLSKLGIVIGGTGTVTIWGYRKRFGDERTYDLIKNLCVLGATLIILLAVGELAVRRVFRDITTTGDNSSYFARRWKIDNVRLNKWGFREREFESSKPDNIYRIAVIGDSITFGQGIAEEDRFTNLLEKSLSMKKNRYEVLNFGKPGAETIDEITILRDVLLKLNPDFILLQWYINDFEGNDYRGRPTPIPLLPSTTLVSIFHRSSALYYLINQQWNLLQQAVGLSGSYDGYMLKRFNDPESLDSKEYEQTLNEFIDLNKSLRVPLGIVMFPHLMNLEKGYRFDNLHDRVEICAQKLITCADLRSTFASYTEYRKLWPIGLILTLAYWQIVLHPNV